MSALQRLATLHRLLSSAAGDHVSLQRLLLRKALDALDMESAAITYIDGDAVVVAQVTDREGMVHANKDVLEHPQFRVLLEEAAVTAVADGTFIGAPVALGEQQHFVTLWARHGRRGAFSDEDRLYVEVLAALLARLLREQQLVEEIAHLRVHDRLTRLPLETPMRERIATATANEPLAQFAVFAVDIDVPRIIEQYDYEIAARLLGFAALRLQAINDHGSLAYRGTTCDFFLVSSTINQARDVEHVANRIQTAFATPFSHGGNDIGVSVHVGVAQYPDESSEGEGVIARAVDAVKRAKAERQSRPWFAASDNLGLVEERRSLTRRLKNAIEQNELVLHYQPYIDIQTRAVAGAEALVRWKNRDGSLLMPDDFLPIVEGTDAMLSLGSWVMTESARFCKRIGERELTIAFNVSPSQLQDPGFFQRLKLAITSAGVDPRFLEIEITESAALVDPLAAKEILLECRRLGLKIALDDFGTGYSSLVYLRQLPADVVKIDRSFVGALPDDPDCGAIAGSIVALSHRLGRLVQAEGIENEAQWRWLHSEGCDLAQGFHIADPMPEGKFIEWIDAYEHAMRA